MKKLMIAAALVCSAAVTQAASVYWGGAVATPDGDGYLATGTQAALLYSSEAFTTAATSLSSWAKEATSDNGGSIVATYTLTEYDARSASAFSSTYTVDGSVDGYYAVLVLNDAGDKASYYYVGEITGTDGASSPKDLLINPSWNPGGGYLTSGGYTVNVPEPTSGLLLLLGIAGLALKRKRA